jgi:hypothetical protein
MAVERPIARGALIAAAVGALLGGCNAAHKSVPQLWFAAHGGTAPSATTAVVCHGFGCQLRTSVKLSAADLGTLRRLLADGARSPAAEREATRAAIAWAEKRVAPTVGSANDVGGLDIWNAGKPGQMDCIDEATNTTSYLLIAQEQGFLRHHTVARPVSRGFFLDGRYPHATAVVVETASGTAYAIDSWPHPNGVEPDVMTLDAWRARSPARG